MSPMGTDRPAAAVGSGGRPSAGVDTESSGSASQNHLPSPVPQRQRTRRQVPNSVFIAGMLLAIFVVATLSLKTQPAALTTAAWWPNAGIAIALGMRFPRRYTWILAVAVAAVTLPAVLWAGRPPLLALALAAAVAVEMAVGTLLLRGREDRSPTLSTSRDLGRFFAIAIAASVLYSVIASGSSWLLGDSDGAWDRLLTAAPKHAAGILLLTPLFMDLPRRQQRASYVESAAQVFTSLGVAIAVFVVNDTLPLAFLPFLPLAWAALRMSTRLLFLVMLAIAIVASLGSANNAGPFAFDRLGAAAGTVTLQAFQMSMVVVFLALSLAVGSERAKSLQLYESEELFRKSFNSSVAGKLMVTRGAVHWTVDRSNSSARELLPGLHDEVATLDEVLGPEATGLLSAAADSLVDENARLTLTLTDGRSLNVSVAVIGQRPNGTLMAVHFHDITESRRVRQLEQDERTRAAEVQRALSPDNLPDTPGWTFGTSTTPANQVGGDFYDVRVGEHHVVVSLGDVMGKGMDAGMLAAATRAVLRSYDPSTIPAKVVSDTARVLEGDLRRISAFVTLAYVLVDMDSGDFSFTDAGHGLHFVTRAQSGQIERIASTDMPLGLGEQWREITGSLAPGDTILLVSDGVLDLWGGSVEGLREAIALCVNRDGISPQAFVDELCAVASSRHDLDDDVTAVALRRER
jgi:sigma-B regulation protein RsbU (phosphoserine phosphatase)